MGQESNSHVESEDYILFFEKKQLVVVSGRLCGFLGLQAKRWFSYLIRT